MWWSYVLIGVLALVIFGFVLAPLLRAWERAAPDEATARLADLLAQRDALVQALRDLELDRETGKITEQEYRETRQSYLRDAAQIVRQLEQYEQVVSAEIDRQIEQLRRLAQSASVSAGRQSRA
ncbi:hypothetical protein [Thermorudis peleae]|uniref:hypothetical protein n=1 Tax=Thermorudis peleae TaxID=1382356 RepID=UPI00056F9224|nr:hypothetical protein [Thermorudis peleae]MBX6753153.1 hypothetical protein [Thermorudis peleae]